MDAAMRRSSGTPSPFLSRLRGESGQGVVEFAMVVPLLCLIIIAILHFGKVMNYWLDLNHVASEGRAQGGGQHVSDGYGEYRRRTSATGSRRTSCAPAARRSIPSRGRRSRSACRRDRDVGDPVTVAGRGRLQPARSSERRSRFAAARRCGSSSRRASPAGLRVSTARAWLSSRDEDGRHRRLRRAAAAVRAAASSRSRVDIGNWWVHKRHLQLQVDAAALAGGALFGECFTDPAAANTAIQNEATRFGGAAGSSYNGQVGGANKGTITLLYQSKTYAAGSRRGRRHRDAAARATRRA